MGGSSSCEKKIGRYDYGGPVLHGSELRRGSSDKYGTLITEYNGGNDPPAGYRKYASTSEAAYAIKDTLAEKFSVKAWEKIWDANADAFKSALESGGAILAGIGLGVAKDAFATYSTQGMAAAEAFLVTKGVPPSAAHALIQIIAKQALDIANKNIDELAVKVDAAQPSEARGAIMAIRDIASRAMDLKVGSYFGISGVTSYSGACELCCDGTGKRVIFGRGDDEVLKNITDYSVSANRMAKEKIAEKILDTISTLFDGKITGTTLNDRAKSCVDYLRKIDSVKGTAEEKKNLIMKIIKTVNSAFGYMVIDTSLPYNEMISNAVDVIISLQSGIYTEFVIVHQNIVTVIKNLKVLVSIMRLIQSKLKLRNDNAHDGKNLQYDAIYTSITTTCTAMELQISLLENLVNSTTSKSDAILASIIKKNPLLREGRIKDIRSPLMDSGSSSDISKIIVNVLRSLGVTAQLASMVNDALMIVGMTMSDFKNMANLGELRDKLNDKILTEAMDDNTRAKVHEAMEIILSVADRANELADVYERSKTGSRDNTAVKFNGVVMGGDYKESNTHKHLKNKNMMRTVVYGAFWKKLTAIYDNLMNLLDKLADKIGVEIPVSYDVTRLRDTLNRLKFGIISHKDIYKILLHTSNNAVNKQIKTTFIGQLNSVADICNSMIEDKQNSAAVGILGDIVSTMRAFSDLINNTSTGLVDKLGAFDDGDDDDDNDDLLITGGGLDDFAEPKFPQYGTGNNIIRTLNKFDHSYNVAQIKQHIKEANKNREDISGKYKDDLTNNISVKMSALESTRVLRKQNAIAAGDIDVAKILDRQYEVRIKFWSTVEHVEQYLQEFVETLVKSPDAINDIKEYLDSVKYISDDKYNTISGTKLASALFVGPNPVIDADAGLSNLDDRITAGIAADILEAKCDLIRDSLLNLTALKNMLSLFYHVGAKYMKGGLTGWMKPRTVYDNIINFVSYTWISVLDGTESRHDAPIVRLVDTVAPDIQLEYFILHSMLEAMAGKLLTITGAFSLFKRVKQMTAINPVRMILGGGGDTPKIHSEYTEVYFRIPWLLSFYSRLFKYNEAGEFKNRGDMPLKNKAVKITMLPDITGTYAKLFWLMFVKFGSRDMSSLNDVDIKEIISELNAICQQKSNVYPGLLAVTIANEIKSEVNKRYGIISKDDLAEFEKYYNMTYDDLDNFDALSEFDDLRALSILPDEENDTITRLGPAEIKAGTHKYNPNDGMSNYNVVKSHYVLLREFRNLIERELTSQTKFVSFAHQIRNTQKKIDFEADNDKKLAVLLGLLRGSSSKNTSHNVKYYMFHETVVTGVNSLCLLYTVLVNFTSFCRYAALPNVFRLMSGDTVDDVFPVDSKYPTLLKEDIEKLRDSIFSDNNYRISVNTPVNIRNMTAPNFINLIKKNTTDMTENDRATINNEVTHCSPTLASWFGAIISELCRITTDTKGLCDIRIDGTNVNISFENLKRVARTMMSQIEYFAELLRGDIDENIYKKYVSKGIGSLKWIKNKLEDCLFEGRKTKLRIEQHSNIITNFMNLAQILSPIRAVGFFDAVMDHIVYPLKNLYIDSAPGSSVSSKLLTPKFEDMSTDRLLIIGEPGMGRINTKYLFRIQKLHNKNLDYTNTPLLIEFNHILIDYIDAFFDPISMKMYGGLLSGPAGAVIMPALTSCSFYPDVMPCVAVKHTNTFLNPSENIAALVRPTLSPAMAQNRNSVERAIRYLIDERVSVALAPFVKSFGGQSDVVLAGSLINIVDRISESLDGRQYGGAHDVIIQAMLDDPTTLVNSMAGSAPRNTFLIRCFDYASRQTAAANGPDTGRVCTYIIDHTRAKITLMEYLDVTYYTSEHDDTSNADSEDVINRKISKLYSDVLKPILSAIMTPANEMSAIPTYSDEIDEKDYYTHIISLDDEMFVYDHKNKIVPMTKDTFRRLGIDPDQVNGLADSAQTFAKIDGRDLPAASQILYASTGRMLTCLLKTKQKGSQYYITTNISDVTTAMKEKYRALLPQFHARFKKIMKHLDILKPIVGMMKSDGARGEGMMIARPDPTFPPIGPSSGDYKHRIIALIDELYRYSASFASTCEHVMRDVGDDIKYMEISQNSIKEFKSLHGEYQLMPISTVLGFANRNTSINLSSQSYKELSKYLYAVRGILCPIDSKPMPSSSVISLSNMAEQYNVFASQSKNVDMTTLNGFWDNFASLSEYLYSSIVLEHNSKNVWCSNHNVSSDRSPARYYTYLTLGTNPALPLVRIDNKMNDLAPDPNGDVGVIVSDNDIDNCVYSIRNTLEASMSLAVSPSDNNTMSQLIKHVSTAGGPDTMIDVLNIIDMNFVPIDIHALRKDIPLCMIFNLAYTFEKIVNDYLHNDSTTSPGFKTKHNAESIILELMQNLDTPFKANINRLARMVTGNTKIGELGRPKYLSDVISHILRLPSKMDSLLADDSELMNDNPLLAPARVIFPDAPYVDSAITSLKQMTLDTLPDAYTAIDAVMAAVGCGATTSEDLLPYDTIKAIRQAVISLRAKSLSADNRTLYNAIKTQIVSPNPAGDANVGLIRAAAANDAQYQTGMSNAMPNIISSDIPMPLLSKTGYVKSTKPTCALIDSAVIRFIVNAVNIFRLTRAIMENHVVNYYTYPVDSGENVISGHLTEFFGRDNQRNNV